VRSGQHGVSGSGPKLAPAVKFLDIGENLAGETADGSKFLIEGKPAVLDHLAVCTMGVWDKGQEPTGIDREGAVDDIAEGKAVSVVADAIVTQDGHASDTTESQNRNDAAHPNPELAALLDKVNGLYRRVIGDAAPEFHEEDHPREPDQDASQDAPVDVVVGFAPAEEHAEPEPERLANNVC
jgi:hypothetical protein